MNTTLISNIFELSRKRRRNVGMISTYIEAELVDEIYFFYEISKNMIILLEELQNITKDGIIRDDKVLKKIASYFLVKSKDIESLTNSYCNNIIKYCDIMSNSEPEDIDMLKYIDKLEENRYSITVFMIDKMMPNDERIFSNENIEINLDDNILRVVSSINNLNSTERHLKHYFVPQK